MFVLAVTAAGCVDSQQNETPTPAVRRDGLRPDAAALLKEIVPQAYPDYAPTPAKLVTTSKYIFFSSYDLLWRTDGTAEGTIFLRDLNVTSYPAISNLTAVGERVFFAVDDGASGIELWSSDGTSDGTRMVKDLKPGSSYDMLDNFTAVSGLLYFTAQDGSQLELWKSDGTDDGTVRVFQFGQGTAPQRGAQFTALGSVLYFQGYHPTSGYELWKTDGTAGGTVLVADITGGTTSSTPQKLTPAGGLLYFLAAGTVYRTDGTQAGTVPLVTRSGGYPSSFDNLTALGSKLFFTAYDQTNGDALWMSDGTPGGTKVLKDIEPTSKVTAMDSLTACGPYVFFDAVPASLKHELWRTDGTSSGTLSLKTFFDQLGGLTCAGDTLFYLDEPNFGESRLGVSDGSPAGTSNLQAFKRGQYTNLPTLLTPWGSKLAFVFDGSAGSKIWVSNGGSSGTAEIPFVSRTLGQGTRIEEWIEVGGKLMFTAMEWEGGVMAVVHPWLTDGTPEGTTRLDAYMESPAYALGRSLVKAGSKVFFVGEDATDGPELWVTDGTNSGTHEVKNIGPRGFSGFPRYFAALNDIVLFQANDGVYGTELWRSDGTEAGTSLVVDLTTTQPGSEPKYLTTLGDLVYFVASDGVTGPELWRTDGTAAGTTQVADLRPGAMGSSPTNLLVFDGKLYFTADDGTSGQELWRLDSSGPVRLTDIYPGSYGSSPTEFMATSTALYFAATSDTLGTELYKVEGGTVSLVGDFLPGSSWSSPHPIAASGNVLYFVATDGTHGRELWRTDGTPAGMRLVKDLSPGPESSFTRDAFRGEGFTLSDGTVLFAANQGASGRELWRTDGTEAGTVPVLELMPGAESSNPSVLGELNGRVLVLAADPASGAEVRTFPLALLNDKTPPTVTCPELTVEAKSASGADATFSVSASDDLGGAVEVSSARSSGSVFPLGLTEFNVTATDEAGNSASCTARVTVKDTTPPTLQCPESFSIQAIEASGARPTWTMPSASDAVGSPTVTSNPVMGSLLPVGTNDVTITAADPAGNTTSCHFNITVTQKPDPVTPPGPGDTPSPGDGTQTPEGCGCGSAAGALPLLAWWSLGLLLRRRRR